MILSLLFTSLSLASATTPGVATLWKQYYLYSVNGKARGYFEETAERRPKEKQLAVSQNWVEMDDGTRTETFNGSVAKDDAHLTPVAFFSERSAGKFTYKIDGRAKGKTLSMNFKPTSPEGPAVHKTTTLQSNTIFSNFVPLFLKKLDPNSGPASFAAVVEDAHDGNFTSRKGVASFSSSKREIEGKTCRKANVNFDGSKSEWWVAVDDGRLCEFTAPTEGARLKLSTEADAKKALGN